MKSIVERVKTGDFSRLESLRLRSEIQHVFGQHKIYGKYFTCLYTVSDSCEVVSVGHARYAKLFSYNRDLYVKVLRSRGLYPSDAPYNDTAIAVGVLGVSSFRKVAFVVSKKVHRRANVRNRVKRRMRHLYRLHRHGLPIGTKVVVIAHKRTIDPQVSFAEMHQDFGQIVGRISSLHGKGLRRCASGD